MPMENRPVTLTAASFNSSFAGAPAASPFTSSDDMYKEKYGEIAPTNP